MAAKDNKSKDVINQIHQLSWLKKQDTSDKLHSPTKKEVFNFSTSKCTMSAKMSREIGIQVPEIIGVDEESDIVSFADKSQSTQVIKEGSDTCEKKSREATLPAPVDQISRNSGEKAASPTKTEINTTFVKNEPISVPVVSKTNKSSGEETSIPADTKQIGTNANSNQTPNAPTPVADKTVAGSGEAVSTKAKQINDSSGEIGGIPLPDVCEVNGGSGESPDISAEVAIKTEASPGEDMTIATGLTEMKEKTDVGPKVPVPVADIEGSGEKSDLPVPTITEEKKVPTGEKSDIPVPVVEEVDVPPGEKADVPAPVMEEVQNYSGEKLEIPVPALEQVQDSSGEKSSIPAPAVEVPGENLLEKSAGEKLEAPVPSLEEVENHSGEKLEAPVPALEAKDHSEEMLEAPVPALEVKYRFGEMLEAPVPALEVKDRSGEVLETPVPVLEQVLKPGEKLEQVPALEEIGNSSGTKSISMSVKIVDTHCQCCHCRFANIQNGPITPVAVTQQVEKSPGEKSTIPVEVPEKIDRASGEKSDVSIEEKVTPETPVNDANGILETPSGILEMPFLSDDKTREDRLIPEETNQLVKDDETPVISSPVVEITETPRKDVETNLLPVTDDATQISGESQIPDSDIEKTVETSDESNIIPDPVTEEISSPGIVDNKTTGNSGEISEIPAIVSEENKEIPDKSTDLQSLEMNETGKIPEVPSLDIDLQTASSGEKDHVPDPVTDANLHEVEENRDIDKTLAVPAKDPAETKELSDLPPSVADVATQCTEKSIEDTPIPVSSSNTENSGEMIKNDLEKEISSSPKSTTETVEEKLKEEIQSTEILENESSEVIISSEIDEEPEKTSEGSEDSEKLVSDIKIDDSSKDQISDKITGEADDSSNQPSQIAEKPEGAKEELPKDSQKILETGSLDSSDSSDSTLKNDESVTEVPKPVESLTKEDSGTDSDASTLKNEDNNQKPDPATKDQVEQPKEDSIASKTKEELAVDVPTDPSQSLEKVEKNDSASQVSEEIINPEKSKENHPIEQIPEDNSSPVSEEVINPEKSKENHLTEQIPQDHSSPVSEEVIAPENAKENRPIELIPEDSSLGKDSKAETLKIEEKPAGQDTKTNQIGQKDPPKSDDPKPLQTGTVPKDPVSKQEKVHKTEPNLPPNRFSNRPAFLLPTPPDSCRLPEKPNQTKPRPKNPPKFSEPSKSPNPSFEFEFSVSASNFVKLPKHPSDENWDNPPPKTPSQDPPKSVPSPFQCKDEKRRDAPSGRRNGNFGRGVTRRDYRNSPESPRPDPYVCKECEPPRNSDSNRRFEDRDRNRRGYSRENERPGRRDDRCSQSDSRNRGSPKESPQEVKEVKILKKEPSSERQRENERSGRRDDKNQSDYLRNRNSSKESLEVKEVSKNRKGSRFGDRRGRKPETPPRSTLFYPTSNPSAKCDFEIEEEKQRRAEERRRREQKSPKVEEVKPPKVEEVKALKVEEKPPKVEEKPQESPKKEERRSLEPIQKPSDYANRTLKTLPQVWDMALENLNIPLENPKTPAETPKTPLESPKEILHEPPNPLQETGGSERPSEPLSPGIGIFGQSALFPQQHLAEVDKYDIYRQDGRNLGYRNLENQEMFSRGGHLGPVVYDAPPIGHYQMDPSGSAIYGSKGGGMQYYVSPGYPGQGVEFVPHFSPGYQNLGGFSGYKPEFARMAGQVETPPGGGKGYYEAAVGGQATVAPSGEAPRSPAFDRMFPREMLQQGYYQVAPPVARTYCYAGERFERYPQAAGRFDELPGEGARGATKEAGKMDNSYLEKDREDGNMPIISPKNLLQDTPEIPLFLSCNSNYTPPPQQSPTYFPMRNRGTNPPQPFSRK